MKLRKLAISLFLTVAMLASAQPALREPEMYVGAQGGVLASMMLFNPTINLSPLYPHWGANAGVVFRYAGHRYCGLQVELNYMQRGWRERATDTSIEYSRRLDYIELPFLTHIYFGKNCRGFVNIGPQIGFLLYDSKPATTDLSYQRLTDISQRFDWGAAGGLGFYAITIAGTWQLEARFNFSLSNIFDNSAGAHFANSEHMNLSLNFAYLWKIK